MKYQLRAGLAFLAVYRRIGSILTQVPTTAIAMTSVALVLTVRAAQGEYRQIGVSTNPVTTPAPIPAPDTVALILIGYAARGECR